jgi:hypothetical protein
MSQVRIISTKSPSFKTHFFRFWWDAVCRSRNTFCWSVGAYHAVSQLVCRKTASSECVLQGAKKMQAVMTLHNNHVCGEELWAQRSERGTVTPCKYIARFDNGFTSACRSSQLCLSFRVSHQNPIRNPFPLTEKWVFGTLCSDRVRLLLRVICYHFTGFYRYSAFKWLQVVRPRCKSKYHDIVLRCVCPCHLAVGMFCGHQRKQWNGSSSNSLHWGTASAVFLYQRPHKQPDVKQ